MQGIEVRSEHTQSAAAGNSPHIALSMFTSVLLPVSRPRLTSGYPRRLFQRIDQLRLSQSDRLLGQ